MSFWTFSKKKLWILNLSNMSHIKHKVSYAFYRHVAKHVRWDCGFYEGFLHPNEVPFYLPDIITITSMSSSRRRSYAWSSFSSWPSAKRHLSNYHRASKLEAISKYPPPEVDALLSHVQDLCSICSFRMHEIEVKHSPPKQNCQANAETNQLHLVAIAFNYIATHSKTIKNQ